MSRIIRHFTKSEVSHAWLLLDDPLFECQMVMEASEFGLILTPFDKFRSKNDVITVIEPKAQLDTGIKAAGAWLGEAYDFGGLIGTAFVLFGRFLKRRWKNPFDSSTAMFCSEFVVKVMQASNYPGIEVFDAASTTPQDVIDFMRSPT